MTRLAYINGEITTSKFRELKKKEVTKILIDIPINKSNGEQVTNSLDDILNILVSGDQLIIDDLASLKRTLTELALFLKEIEQKNIDLIILNKDRIFDAMTDSEFFSFIKDTHNENQAVLNEKAKQVRKISKSAGRPKLSQEKIDQIRDLRLEKKCTLKETAKICNVSIGTVHKYADSQ